MRQLQILSLAVIIFFLYSCKNKVDKELLHFAPFPVPVPEENSLMAQWEKKPVSGIRLLDDMENGKGWKVTGIGELSYTKDRSTDGTQSLRFRTSLRDEEHYRKNRTEWGSFGGTQGGTSSIIKKFDTPQDWSDFNRISFRVYVHPTTMMTYCLFLLIENEGTIYNATYPGKAHFIQDLKPGEWNHVMFEIPHLERSRVTEFEITQMLTGHGPEDEGIVTYDIDQIELQRVETDQFEGWNVAPGKFAFSHIGYRPSDTKIALAGVLPEGEFQIIDSKDEIVFTGPVKQEETINGRFSKLDFSDFSNTGIFRIRCGAVESKPFPVGETIWQQPVYNALNFFFCERCGFNVPGIHRECHKDWQGFHGDDKKIINGGWHDAGDLSQGSWRTAMSVLSMMANLENLEGNKDAIQLTDKLNSEIRWGLDWLLKTRFGGGYHMSFSVMRIYTDNKVGTIDDVLTPARNVPWENFLAAAVQCKAAMLYEKTDPGLSGRARDAAIDDWQAAVESRTTWDQADFREASWGATSSILLGRMTGEQKYYDYAIKFGELLTRCQEQGFRDSIPVTGYFYENTDRQEIIHNYHAAFEEAPLIALAMLCNSFPENENWINWYSAAVLHSEFFMKRGALIATPYNHLPNSVWKKSEIMVVKDDTLRNDLLRQFNDGTTLGNDWVLRTFPIYFNGLFHGNTNIQMSGTWALAEASKLRRDTAGMKLAGKQLEWVFGANPFGQSLMYGTGYDFAPHFAYCLKNVVGSLPVGMDCMSGDMPHWSATNTATSKEIWVEPVNRFLGAVSVYTSGCNNESTSGKQVRKLEIETEREQSENGNVLVTIVLKGSGRHLIEVRSFNTEEGFIRREVDLAGDRSERLQLDLTVKDMMKPYVAVITPDNDQDMQKEIVGAFVIPSF